MTEDKDKALKLFKVNTAYDQQMLQTKSMHHQFYALRGYAIKRYVKAVTASVYVKRVDMWRNPQKAPDGMMVVALITDTKEWDHVSAIPLKYNNDVIELYTQEDVDSFENLNKKSIDEGTLVEYVEGLEYEYTPQNYHTAEFHANDGSIEHIKRPYDFVLMEKQPMFEHTLRKSVVKRGN